MLDIMHKGLKKALKSCDQAEIYGECGDVFSVDLEREEVKKVKHVKSTGIGVRVVRGKKIGFSYTTALEDARIDECVEHAIKLSKVSEQDTHFHGLPGAETSKQGYTKPEESFDPRITELLEGGSEDAIQYCKRMLNGAKEYKLSKSVTCTPTEGGFAAARDETYILNSEGIETSDSGTYVSAGLMVVAREASGSGNGEEISGYEGEVSRMLTGIDFEWIGREAVKMAVDCFGAKKPKTKEVPVVFSPRAVQSLLAYTLIPQLSAENVQRNQSPYRGKKGQEIAAEILTVVDNGTMPGGVNSRRMDGEGVPAQPTKLVENGVLNNFLYDSYTAGKDGVESTGNAIRGFSNLPTPGATNFIINAGSNASKEEMFAEIREGLFVNDVIGAHTASRASGDFSVVAQNSFGIKEGELYPVTQVMLAGNMQEILKHVELIGNDTRQIYNVVSPSVKVSRVQVVS